jgi:hypothetical protein
MLQNIGTNWDNLTFYQHRQPENCQNLNEIGKFPTQRSLSRFFHKAQKSGRGKTYILGLSYIHQEHFLVIPSTPLFKTPKV